MFFVRQKSNQCGLHAIQNLFKSAKVTNIDMHEACQSITDETGDQIQNHETCGGDWSVSAVLKAIVVQGYTVQSAISSRAEREWVAANIDDLLQDCDFRGIIVHQPVSHHFICLRPETIEDTRQLFYVDSQSSGPICISPKLAIRRCVARAYAWEPYVVMGPEMDFVEAVSEFIHEKVTLQRAKRPSEDFMKAWDSFKSSKTPE